MLEDVRDHIDELYEELSISGAGPTLEKIARDLPVKGHGRAEYLTSAAESYLLAERTEDAKRCARDAIEDGGEAVLIPEAQLMHIFLTEGDHDAADEISAALRKRARDLSVFDIEQIAEAYEMADRLKEAQRWFTIALRPYDPEDVTEVGSAAYTAAIRRRRVRQRMGLPEDRFDQAADQAHTELFGESPQPDAETLPPMAVLYWPKEEFKRYIALYPDLAEGYDWSHRGHRDQVREKLEEFAAGGVEMSVAPATVDGLLDFADERGLDPAGSQARSYYAAEIRRLGKDIAWPPAQQDRCWCGSGKTYGRCCGSSR
jgi:tetratricopeptide (TPR) repeat protein